MRPAVDRLLIGRQSSLAGRHVAAKVLSYFVVSADAPVTVLEFNSVGSLGLTMGESNAHQKNGRGYGGEQEDHGHDWKDEGGIIDSCLGVVAAVRHCGLQHGFCLTSFQEVTVREAVAITSAESCQCKPWR